MDSKPAPFDSDAPLGACRPIIRRNPADASETEMVEATWGSNPRFADGASFRFVRYEGRTFPSQRCLVPASEFQMTVGTKRYRVTLTGGNYFYLAAVWEPPMGEWGLSYRIITIPANPEVALYQDRHGALIHRRQAKQWLDMSLPETALIVTPPARTFLVEQITPGQRQKAFAL